MLFLVMCCVVDELEEFVCQSMASNIGWCEFTNICGMSIETFTICTRKLWRDKYQTLNSEDLFSLSVTLSLFLHCHYLALP
jgi:hypothetical protein